MIICARLTHPRARQTRSGSTHEGGLGGPRIVRKRLPERRACRLENTHDRGRKLVREPTPIRRPDEWALEAPNRPVFAPGAYTGWRVLFHLERFRIAHWSHSPFRPVDPRRYGHAVLSVRLPECTHPSLLKLEPDKSCTNVPGTVLIGHPSACCSIFLEIEPLRPGRWGRHYQVLSARIAFHGDSRALLSAIMARIFCCVTVRSLISSTHVRTINISGEAPASGGLAGQCLAGA
jgi:hypothetical protein